MGFTPKAWEDAPSTATPINSTALDDLEARLAAYSEALAYAMDLQEGVRGAGDLAVTQHAAGANMSVDVAAGVAVVQDDSSSAGALSWVSPAAATLTITAASGANPRVDMVVVSKAGVLSVVAGTPTAGATLDNRNGAAALPASSALLADVLVGTSVSSIANGVIRDRRLWARGAHYQFTGSGSNYTTTSTAFVAMDSTNMSERIECSGGPLSVELAAEVSLSATGFVAFALYVDGVTAGNRALEFTSSFSLLEQACLVKWNPSVSAGSHVFELRWKVSTGTGTINISDKPTFEIAEDIRGAARNNALTSG